MTDATAIIPVDTEARSPRRFGLGHEDARLMGVCSGIANYTGIDATLVRIGLVLGTVFGLGWLVIAYIAVGLIAD